MKKTVVAVIIVAALVAGVTLGSNFFQVKNFAGDPPAGFIHFF